MKQFNSSGTSPHASNVDTLPLKVNSCAPLNRFDPQYAMVTNWAKPDRAPDPSTTQHLCQHRYGYILQKDGSIINVARSKAIVGEARSAFHALKKEGLAPGKWGEVTTQARDFVFNTLESRFEELRYCDDHWKVQRLCTTVYSYWHADHGSTGAKNLLKRKPGQQAGMNMNKKLKQEVCYVRFSLSSLI